MPDNRGPPLPLLPPGLVGAIRQSSLWTDIVTVRFDSALADCLKVYTDTDNATGTKTDRPQWNACLGGAALPTLKILPPHL